MASAPGFLCLRSLSALRGCGHLAASSGRGLGLLRAICFSPKSMSLLRET